MGVYDPTIFNLIRAGDKTAANDALEDGHPDAYIETTGASVEFTVVANRATSGSSNTIGTGPLTFTLDSARSWVAGTPVRIMDVGAPDTNFMQGVLSTDEVGGVINVTVTDAAGSGTFSSWSIIIVDSATSVASPPVGVPDGGWGTSTKPTGRAAWELVRRFLVEGWVSTPPGAPSTGETWIVGDNPTGAWAGQEADIAVYNGATWDFETPAEGDLAWVSTAASDGEPSTYLVHGALSPTEAAGLWAGSPWKFVSSAGVPRRFTGVVDVGTGTYSAVIADNGKRFTIGNGGILTLPITSGLAGIIDGMEVFVTSDPAAGGNGTINVIGAKKIRYNGADSTSITVEPGHNWYLICGDGAEITTAVWHAFKN